MKQDYTETDAWDAVLGVCVLWRETQDNKKLIDKLRADLRQCLCPRPINGAADESTGWCVDNGHCGCGRNHLLGVNKGYGATQGYGAPQADLKEKSLITKARSVRAEE